ncbi:MAG: acyltransferase [Betaproteobacteria bacterium]|nr:acyltransferase [Betaproteobacteria bacterium]
MEKAEKGHFSSQGSSIMTAPASGYMPYLDGVRGISSLLVAFSHVGFGHFVPGGLGVTIFFFISGFLITSLLRQERETTGSVSLRRFYLRRVWRLYPALLAYVTISLIFTVFVGQKIEIKEPLFVLFYLSNYYNLFFGYVPIFNTYSPFGIQGSLAIEEHFYLLFAPLVLLIKNRRNLIGVVVLMLIIPLIARIFIIYLTDHSEFSSNYTYSATECRLDCIAYGCALALIDWPKLSKTKSFVIGIGGVLLILFSLLIRDNYFRETFRFSVQGIGLMMIFIPTIFSEFYKQIRNGLSNIVLVYVGKLSYSIYLYHWLVIIALRIFVGDIQISLLWQSLFWILSFGLSIFSYYLVEQPFMKFRRKYGSNI